MNNPSTEIKIANLAFMAFWILTAALLLAFGQRWPRTHAFRQKMLAQWQPSLVIALVFWAGMVIGGRGLLNPYPIAIFCMAQIGLALATGIPGYEPLPVTQSVQRGERPWRKVILLLVISVLVVVPALLIGSVGLSIGQQIFHEQNRSGEAMSTMPTNKWSTFFLLLSGAGVAEETPYRLVVLSLIWRLTRRRKLAICVSALIFGLYHLTPLTGMYRTFWLYPVSQFVASALIGLVWGYLYVKRGFETAVLGHTLSDWIPFMIFVR